MYFLWFLSVTQWQMYKGPVSLQHWQPVRVFFLSPNIQTNVSSSLSVFTSSACLCRHFLNTLIAINYVFFFFFSFFFFFLLSVLQHLRPRQQVCLLSLCSKRWHKRCDEFSCWHWPMEVSELENATLLPG